MRLLIFGFGYSAGYIARAARSRGAVVTGTTRDGREDTLRFDDRERVLHEIAGATHILSSVPPSEGRDPVLAAYGDAIAQSGAWLGYLSSTGVYGDAQGAWVDESASIGGGRRVARAEADAAWQARGASVFRLPGIYGPDRSPLDRVREGKAHRVDVPDQIFSRVHVEDIASGVIAGFDAPSEAYNLSDDEPAPQNAVIDYAAMLLGMAPPPFVSVDDLSPMARGFYAENRRVANGKAKRILGWRPLYPNYRLGLRALSATTIPIMPSAPPASASGDQR
ncbi:NAD(P)-dependent oxidoreductase [Stakelama pacifica]|uniref:Nucleoside-diphosphate-sugar epimerase n=1 Tax=Stakelama pacifica TaxID=517720 RepID=A0A4R6FLZ5_9SPHN|nr:NAD(P)-dependent oxidoreductase [Stakelama pacifica]TDN81664.1 nucleoside-diphosphate-sugar epimerase [Stakelama pacifica]GGO96199.1 NAD(P)-dependent oxidoreductase [Stakelama pacifica]